MSTVVPSSGVPLGPAHWPSWEEHCTHNGCWPRLFILGAQKAATTSLFSGLLREGLVCAARVHPDGNHTSSGWQPNTGNSVLNQNIKEVHLLDAPRSRWQDVAANAKKYTSLFRHTDCERNGSLPGRRFLDATPAYLRTPSAPARLVQIVPQRWLPELRMLILVREPVARDLSWYNHKLVENEERKRDGSALRPYSFCIDRLSGGPSASSSLALTYSAEVLCQKYALDTCMSNGTMLSRIHLHENFNFEEKEQMLREYWSCTESTEESSDHGAGPVLLWGFYAPQIATWRSTRGLTRSQMLILDYDDLWETPNTTLNTITSFYGLPRLRDTRLPEANTKTSSAKVETISCSTKQQLVEIYRPWNRMLFDDLWQDHEHGAHPPDEPRFKGFGDSRVKCTDALMSPTAESHAVQIDPTEQHAHSKFLFHTDQGALIQPGAL